MDTQKINQLPAEVVDIVMNSPLTESWRQERQRVADREKWSAEITALDGRQKAELPALRQAVEAARAKVEVKYTELEELRQQLREAEAEEYSLRLNLSNNIDRLRLKLQQSADLRIDSAIHNLRKNEEDVRANGLIIGEVPDGFDAFGRQLFRSVNNSEEVNNVLDGLRSAKRQLEALKMETIDGKELAMRIHAILAAVPQLAQVPFREEGLPLLRDAQDRAHAFRGRRGLFGRK